MLVIEYANVKIKGIQRAGINFFRSKKKTRLAETLTRDWLNTNKQREMVMSTITLLYIIIWLTTELTVTLLNACPTVQTIFNDGSTLESWYTNIKQTPFNQYQQEQAPYSNMYKTTLFDQTYT